MARTSPWVPLGSFGLALLLSLLHGPARLLARPQAAATGTCHVFGKTPGDELCQSAENGAAENPANCDVVVPADNPLILAEERTTLKKSLNGSVRSSRSVRDGGYSIAFPKGTLFLTEPENSIEKRLTAPLTCPCHDVQIFVRAALDVRLTVSAPDLPSEKAFAAAYAEANLAATRSICELRVEIKLSNLDVAFSRRRSPTGRLEDKTSGRWGNNGKKEKPPFVIDGDVASCSVDVQIPPQPRRFDIAAVTRGEVRADAEEVEAAEGAAKTASSAVSVTFTYHDHYDIPEGIGERNQP
jgi:hypothetical protein